MINDIGDKHFDKTVRHCEPRPQDRLLAYKPGKIFMTFRNDGAVELPRIGDLQGPMRSLFSIDKERFFLWDSQEELSLRGYDYVSNFVLRTMKPHDLCFAGTTGYHLSVWYKNHRYCGKCGSLMKDSEKERALVCPQCGNTVYPVISPACVAAIIRDDKILLTKYAGREYQGYAVVAGFMEIGETAADTLVREIREEVGIRVKNLRYYKSLPWGFDSGILIGFFAEAEEGEEVKADQCELSEARWFKREEMTPIDEPVFLGAEMMELFRKGEDPYSLERKKSCAR